MEELSINKSLRVDVGFYFSCILGLTPWFKPIVMLLYQTCVVIATNSSCHLIFNRVKEYSFFIEAAYAAF